MHAFKVEFKNGYVSVVVAETRNGGVLKAAEHFRDMFPISTQRMFVENVTEVGAA